MHSDLQTFKFVLIISIFSALLLSLTSTTLKNRQEVNIEVDRKKNVLKCAGIDVSTLNSDAVIKKYQSFITEKVITTDGDLTEIPYENLFIDENKSTGQITYYNNDKIMSEDTIQKEYLPLFEYKINGKVNAYILPPMSVHSLQNP